MKELYWTAVYVRSRHEFKVYDRLQKGGLEAFLPYVKRLSKWKDRKKLISFPLFPGYLFVRIRRHSYDDLLAVLKDRAVVGFVGGTPGNPECVPDEQIDSLKRLLDNESAIDPYPYVKEGQRVRIKKGPLTGACGILLDKGKQHLFIVSVDLFCRSVSVKIDASDVEAI